MCFDQSDVSVLVRHVPLSPLESNIQAGIVRLQLPLSPQSPILNVVSVLLRTARKMYVWKFLIFL